jgi:hypothetical protein
VEDATCAAPIVPFAPPRFSKITGTPSDLEINGPTIRGIVSLVLPAGKGTTIVIGLSGKPAAPAQGTARDAVDRSIAKINVVQFLSSCSFRIPKVPFKYPEKALPLTFGPFHICWRLD